MSVVLGVAMVAEALLFLWIGWSRFDLATNDNALYTFSFLLLLYFAVFSVVSARERHWFWSTMPSKALAAALVADAATGTVLTRVGLPGLLPLPWWQTLRNLRLCPHLVPGCERCPEGRDDQVARDRIRAKLASSSPRALLRTGSSALHSTERERCLNRLPGPT